MRKVIIAFYFALFLTGCEVNVGGHVFYNQINEIEHSLEHPNWDVATVQADELKEIFNHQKWKVQLLGDEDEYESLNESINKLIVAIEEKDLLTTRLELSVIHTHIQDIYSL